MRRLVALAAALVLVLAACAAPTPVRRALTRLDPVRILTLGDSITYGPTLTDNRATTGYRGELERLLTWSGVPHAPLMDRSVVGARVGDLLPYVQPIIDADRPDIVIVAFGTNDAAQPDTLAHFEERYGQLTAAFVAAGVKVIAVFIQFSASPPNSAGYLQAERQVNDAVYRTAIQPGPFGSPLKPGFVGVVRWMDLPSGYLGPDGIHPAGPPGYDAMGWLVYRAIAQHLGLPAAGS